MSTPRFADAMALTESAPGVFDAAIDDNWTIGPKLHGGVMMALCCHAACRGVDPAGDRGLVPVAVTADYLGAPDPGPMRLVTTVRKDGRRISLVDVELRQGERALVRAAVTLGAAERAGDPLLKDPGLTRQPAAPPAEVAPIGPGHPSERVMHLARGVDIRPDLAGYRPPANGAAPDLRLWVRPREDLETPLQRSLFALMCGDVSAPVTFAVRRFGWAPTVTLTAYLRGVPGPGWLRVRCTCAQIGQDWFDADHTVVDAEGRLVVQSRQLALVPAADARI